MSSRKHFLRTVANVADLLYTNRCCRMTHNTPSAVLSFPLRTSGLRGRHAPSRRTRAAVAQSDPKGKASVRIRPRALTLMTEQSLYPLT